MRADCMPTKESVGDSLDMTGESAPLEQAEEFAIIEVFGHRRLAGRIIEVERFGAKLLRIDVPKLGDFANGYDTQYYGGASIFSITPCDLASVTRISKPYVPPARLTYDGDDQNDDVGF